MEKIKKSFTKVLPFVFILYLILTIAVDIINRLYLAIPAWDGVDIVRYIVNVIVVAPLYIGFYKFCFARMNGEKPRIVTIFDFYRSAAGFIKSVAVYALSTTAANLFEYVSWRILTISFGMFGTRDKNTAVLSVAAVIGIFVLCRLFLLAPYAYAETAYAENSTDGLAAAMKKSVRLGLRFILVFALLEIVHSLSVNAAVSLYNYDIYDTVHTSKAVMYAVYLYNFILMLIPNFVFPWITFTAAYMILGTRDKNRNNEAESDETAEETPFIEPYDFFIEADERFNDEKTVETENIRGVDILALFDGMELADDIRVNYSLRRKLKKMFDDLAFEIGEYVTYSGGREIENFFFEEIDDRNFEISVKISRDSDYDKFKLILKVTAEEEV